MAAPDLSGTAFQAREVSELYIHRPPYPASIYAAVIDAAPARRRLLDLGCGEGKIARPMADVFDDVVAVDPSDAMIALGRTLANGDAARLRWICATAEDVALEGHFDVVTFASSIHWMDPARLFTRLRPHLGPGHLIAVISGDHPYDPPWAADWQQFLQKWVPEATGLPLGAQAWQAPRDRFLEYLDVTSACDYVSEPFAQSVEDFIQCQHSRNSFALSKLGNRVDPFRSELRALLKPHQDARGCLSYRVASHLVLARLNDP